MESKNEFVLTKMHLQKSAGFKKNNVRFDKNAHSKIIIKNQNNKIYAGRGGGVKTS